MKKKKYWKKIEDVMWVAIENYDFSDEEIKKSIEFAHDYIEKNKILNNILPKAEFVPLENLCSTDTTQRIELREWLMLKLKKPFNFLNPGLLLLLLAVESYEKGDYEKEDVICMMNALGKMTFKVQKKLLENILEKK